MRASPLARFFLVAYVLLVVYATLYPLVGWRSPGGSALDFLAAPWPRYVTAFDVAANFLGYVPYGVLAALAVRPPLGRGPAALLAALTGAALSLALEAAQSYLPARIPSNVDVLANLAGALAGGVAGATLAPRLLGEGPLRHLRTALFERGARADFGLVLVGLWLFAQLNPATLLFGAGDLRDLVAGAPPGAAGERHGAELFVAIEAATAAANLAAVALLASVLANPGAPAGRLAAALVALAVAVKSIAFAILMQSEHVLAWLTPGAQIGLVAGAAAAGLALRLPRTGRLVLCAVLLMAATVLVNLSPPNPYFAATLKVWEQGHFLNFNGLTRLVSTAWPFAALGCLVWLAAPRRGPTD